MQKIENVSNYRKGIVVIYSGAWDAMTEAERAEIEAGYASIVITPILPPASEYHP